MQRVVYRVPLWLMIYKVTRYFAHIAELRIIMVINFVHHVGKRFYSDKENIC